MKFFLKKLLFPVKENTKQERKVNAFLKKEKPEKGCFFEEKSRKKEKMSGKKYQKSRKK